MACLQATVSFQDEGVPAEQETPAKAEAPLADAPPVISPPLTPGEVKAKNPTIQRSLSLAEEKLVKNGNYFLDQDGIVRSRHFPKAQPYPQFPDTFACPLISGTPEDIRAGELFAYNKNKGLAACVRIETPGAPPIYIIDNHTLAYFAWEESRSMGYLKEGAALLHFDRHYDCFPAPVRPKPSSQLTDAAQYTLTHLDINTFIVPAMLNGTVAEFWNFSYFANNAYHYQNKMWGKLLCSTGKDFLSASCAMEAGNGDGTPFALKEVLSKINGTPLILDIDLDLFIWADWHYKEGLFPRKTAEKALANALPTIVALSKRAGVITIATSPGFADPKMTVDFARRIAAAITEGQLKKHRSPSKD
ncbi:MAG: UPF0489 family protein [Candidatus Saganbacteria bacterium]|nr:UPF0489 family protein [Candidatus Saganbacteria bacterium]